MAWITIGESKTLAHCNGRVYGTLYLQYDNTATGSSVPVRIFFKGANDLSSVYVTFFSLTVTGYATTSAYSLSASGAGAEVTVWQNNITGNQNISATWQIRWTSPYACTQNYSLSGWLPAGGSLPTGLKAEWVSSTWDSVTIKSSVTSWGSYTGTPSIEQIVVDSTATSSNWETKGRQARANSTTATSSTQSVTNSNSTAYSGGITIKGAMDFKVAAWVNTSAYNGGTLNNTVYHTPPAPLQTLSYTQTQGATNVTVNVTITGADSTKNYSNTVTTYYRYSTNGGSSYSSWTSAGTGTPWTSKTASFTCAYKANVVIQAKQTYNSIDSEIKSVSFTATSGTAPSNLSSSITASTWNSVTMNGSASYGNPSGISGRSLTVGVNINGSSLANRRELNTQNVTSVSDVVINNSSSNLGGDFDLKGMLPVYPFAWANNTVQSASSIGSVYYLPPAPGSLTYTTVASGSDIDCTLNYVGVAADSYDGYTAADLTRTVRYKGDEDADWTYVENDTQIALTTATTETVTIAATHSVVIEAWMTYKGKNSTVSTVTVVNNNDPVALYASVNDEATKVIKLYGSVNNETVAIKKLYASVNGVARLVYEDNS